MLIRSSSLGPRGAEYEVADDWRRRRETLAGMAPKKTAMKTKTKARTAKATKPAAKRRTTT